MSYGGDFEKNISTCQVPSSILPVLTSVTLKNRSDSIPADEAADGAVQANMLQSLICGVFGIWRWIVPDLVTDWLCRVGGKPQSSSHISLMFPVCIARTMPDTHADINSLSRAIILMAYRRLSCLGQSGNYYYETEGGRGMIWVMEGRHGLLGYYAIVSSLLEFCLVLSQNGNSYCIIKIKREGSVAGVVQSYLFFLFCCFLVTNKEPQYG